MSALVDSVSSTFLWPFICSLHHRPARLVVSVFLWAFCRGQFSFSQYRLQNLRRKRMGCGQQCWKNKMDVIICVMMMALFFLLLHTSSKQVFCVRANVCVCVTVRVWRGKKKEGVHSAVTVLHPRRKRYYVDFLWQKNKQTRRASFFSFYHSKFLLISNNKMHTHMFWT